MTVLIYLFGILLHSIHLINHWIQHAGIIFISELICQYVASFVYLVLSGTPLNCDFKCHFSCLLFHLDPVCSTLWNLNREQYLQINSASQ
jgi:hypothetical protein